MGGRAYERLSSQDRAFLVFEDAASHMHLGGLALFTAAPLLRPTGGLDIDRLLGHIAARLHLMPRYRQRLGFVPLRGRAVWVDDEHFNLSYHVRHAAVPPPGDDAQLKQLAGRILSQQLDRGKPLWELWIVEGLAEGRFAVLAKVHHALADGLSAFGLFSALLSTEPSSAVERPRRWRPRAAPTAAELLWDEVRHTAAAPLTLVRELTDGLRDPWRLADEVVSNVRAVGALLAAGLRIPASTPLNRPIGPHRRFDFLTLHLAAVKAVKARLGGSLNDVILATVAGAVRRFLRRRRAEVASGAYRIVVPVSVRGEDAQGTVNNHVSGWLTRLPIEERDARRRLAAVRELTAQLKASQQERGPDLLSRALEYALPGALTIGIRLTARLHPYNLIVTNVPGPPVPLYLLGARLLAGYPQVPLFEHQGLGIALLSYAGSLHWGFNADWDLVPDLADFVADVAASFAELRAAAEARGAAGDGLRD